jgi:hypothetical protein
MVRLVLYLMDQMAAVSRKLTIWSAVELQWYELHYSHEVKKLVFNKDHYQQNKVNKILSHYSGNLLIHTLLQYSHKGKKMGFNKHTLPTERGKQSDVHYSGNLLLGSYTHKIVKFTNRIRLSQLCLITLEIYIFGASLHPRDQVDVV